MKELGDLLVFLEENIDENHIANAITMLKKTLNYEKVPYLPIRVNYDSGYKMRTISEVHKSLEAMLYNELVSCVSGIILKDYSLPMIRANYGVGTVPSLFGLKSKIVDGGMPWVEHLNTVEEIRDLVKCGIPDLNNGFGAKISETHKFYRETLKKYPKCNRQIKIYHSDCQGPFDVAHLIWGSDIYMGMYDDPELFHDLMSLVTDTIIKFLDRELEETNGYSDGYNYHWGTLYNGKIVLRDDSSVNLSKDMYFEFIQPYNNRIAKHFESISLHFCGRADQWVKEMIQIPQINGVNFGYMEERFNDDFLRFIKDVCLEQKVSIINYYMNCQEFEKMDKSIFQTGMTIATNTDSLENARKIYNNYTN